MKIGNQDRPSWLLPAVLRRGQYSVTSIADVFPVLSVLR